MNITGKIIVLNNTQTVGSAGTFKKRTVVVETNEKYPQKLAIDFVQDGCSMLDKYKVGETVEIAINHRGNEYNGKYYVSLQGWKIGYAGASADSIQGEKHQASIQDDVDDSLPF